MTYFLSYKSHKGKDHERTCNPHFIFKLQNSFGGICHSNVPCWITGSKNHSNQTNVLFLLSAFLRGSLNAMVSSPSHFWSEVRRERTEPVCYRISGISGIRDSLSSFADSKAKNSGLHKQNCPGFHFSDAKNYRIPESKFLTWGETRQKLNSKKLVHFSQVNHFHPGYFKYKKTLCYCLVKVAERNVS